MTTERRRMQGPGNRNIRGQALYEQPDGSNMLLDAIRGIQRLGARVPDTMTIGSFGNPPERQNDLDVGLGPAYTGATRRLIGQYGPGGGDVDALTTGLTPEEQEDTTVPDRLFRQLVQRALAGDRSVLADLGSYFTEGEWITNPNTLKEQWIPPSLSPRALYIQDILDAVQSERIAMFQQALANPFAFGALNALMGRNYGPLVGGLPSIGFQLPQEGGALFPEGIPTLGALQQAGPEGLQFLQALLGFQGVSPSELQRTAGAVTPAAFRGFSAPVAGGRERTLAPLTAPAILPPSRERELRQAEAGPPLGRKPGAPPLLPPAAALGPLPVRYQEQFQEQADVFPAAGAGAGAAPKSDFQKAFEMYQAWLAAGLTDEEQFNSLVGGLLGGE